MSSSRFSNPHIRDMHRSIWNFFLWKIGHYDEKRPREEVPPSFQYPGAVSQFVYGNPSVVWIGHSTYLIEVDGLSILTDPVWDDYCSPVPLRAFQRYTKPPMALSDLPPIDLVLISHNHYDHLDANTVRQLSKFHPQIEWIVPQKLSSWFRQRSIHSVTELGWWESCKKQGAKITAVPAQHFSGRTLWDKNKTHWNGYVVEIGNKKLYFSGDTGYNEFDFKAIGKQFESLDLSLIPIGTYVPEGFMRSVHISPFEAVQIHQDVYSKLSLGMHWNTFQLSDEGPERPPYDLYLAMLEKKLPFDTFLPIEIGTYVNF